MSSLTEFIGAARGTADPAQIAMPSGLVPGLDATNVQAAIAETYTELSQAMDLIDLSTLLDNQLA